MNYSYNIDMAMTVIAATLIGVLCAPKRAFALLLMLDVVLVMLIEAYASTRLFHDFGDTLFRLAIGAFVSSCLSCGVLALLLYFFRAANRVSADGVPATTIQGSDGAIHMSFPSALSLEEPATGACVQQQKNRDAMFLHIAGLAIMSYPFVNLAVALIIWLSKRKSDSFTGYHVSAMLAFHCVFTAVLLVAFLMHVFLAAAWIVVGVGCICRAAYLAYHGQLRSYPGVEMILALVK